MSTFFTQYADFLDQMSLLWAFILLPVGLTILVKGADWLVDGAVAIAKHFGLSPLIIGLTIVAMGTSAPEVAASIKAALADLPGIAVGNVYGSNIANLALVGGLCAMIRPILVSRPVLRRDIPLMLASALVLLLYFHDGRLGRIESVTMIGIFLGIIGYMVYTENKQSKADKAALLEQEKAVEAAAPHQPRTLWMSFLLIFIGLVCLSEGADLTVCSARIVGKAAGMSETAIGATIVAVGTSLPELMTCLIAAFKGHDDLSVGNLVGSNVFNTLLVIGASGLARPYSIDSYPELAGSYYWLMIAVFVLFGLMAYTAKKITRPGGILLLAAYGGYVLYCLFGIEPH